MTDRIEDYEKQEFTGVDVSLEISLFEYGLIWGKNKECAEDEFLFIHGIAIDDGCNYIDFDSGYLNKEDFATGFYFDDDNIKDIEDFTGMSKNELIDNFPYSVSDIVGYHGAVNVFGCNAYGGYKIYNDDLIMDKLANSLPSGSGINSDWYIWTENNIISAENDFYQPEFDYVKFIVKIDIDNINDFIIEFDSEAEILAVDNCSGYLNDTIAASLKEIEF